MKKKILAVMGMAAAVIMTGCSGDADDYYKQACQYSEDEDYDSAEEYFEKAIDENSEKAEYYIDYGFTLIKMGNAKDSIPQFNKAILSSDGKIVDPDNQITRKNNKQAYRGKGIAYYMNHDYDNAVEFFENALEISELNELNEDIRSYLADSKKNSGDYEGAIEVYDDIIKNNKSADAYAGRASAQYSLGNSEDALADYDNAINEDDSNYNYYFGKYNIYKALGDEEGADKAMEAALSVNDKGAVSSLNKGKIYYMTGDIEKAQGYLSDAKDAGVDEADFYLGLICETAGNMDSALTYLKDYTQSQTGKKSAAAFNELVNILINQKNYEDALTYIETGLKLKDISMDKALRFNEVAAYEGIGDFATAKDKAVEYTGKYPDDEKMTRELEFLSGRVK